MSVQSFKRRMERLELDHLRQLSANLHAQLERLEAELLRANESVEFWSQHAIDLQQALHDDVSTHRCVGINKSGELMVVSL